MLLRKFKPPPTLLLPKLLPMLLLPLLLPKHSQRNKPLKLKQLQTCKRP